MTRAWNEGADALAAWTAAGVAREGALDARLPLFLVGRANASATLPPPAFSPDPSPQPSSTHSRIAYTSE